MNINSLRFFLPCDCLDSYLYSGQLFSIFKDGTLRMFPLIKLAAQVVDTDTRLAGIINLAVLRNDWMLNEQALTFYTAPGFIQHLEASVNQYSGKDVVLNFSENDWIVIGKIPSMPVYDLRVYAWRVYMANRDGVYEKSLGETGNLAPHHTGGLDRIFDARTIYITAKSGELMFSSDEDGLYRGTLWEKEKRTIVHSKPVAKKSLRTGWSGFDVLNYESNFQFTYFKNETEDSETRNFNYSEGDEPPDKKKIKTMGIEVFDLQDLLGLRGQPISDVSYCYNSNETTFWITYQGEVFRIRLNKRDNKVSLSSIPHSVAPGKISVLADKPHSASMFASGSVIEFFDRVVLLREQQITVLENQPAISVRTFPTSRRYKRLICITQEDGVALHAIFPSDKEIRGLFTTASHKSDNYSDKQQEEET